MRVQKMHSFDKEIQFNGPIAISAETQRSGDQSEEQRVTKWVFACCEASQRDKLGQSPTVRHATARLHLLCWQQAACLHSSLAHYACPAHSLPVLELQSSVQKQSWWLKWAIK